MYRRGGRNAFPFLLFMERMKLAGKQNLGAGGRKPDSRTYRKAVK